MAENTDESLDHIGRLLLRRRRESPDVPLDGMAILGRAKRLTALTRPPIETVFERHGIDAGEFDVLATLRRSGAPFELRPTELMRDLLISSGGLTDRLMRLEEKGLIARRRSEEDARSKLACLTAEGRALSDRAYAEDMALEEEMLAGLTGPERRELAALLARLLAHLEGGEAGA